MKLSNGARLAALLCVVLAGIAIVGPSHAAAPDANAARPPAAGSHPTAATATHSGVLAASAQPALAAAQPAAVVTRHAGNEDLRRAAAPAPLIVVDTIATRIDFSRTDGGLPLFPGAETHVVMKADREHPEFSDGLGWTYHHHPDMAVWHGKMYVAWNSCLKDEDTYPSRELYSTSADGKFWSHPQELFPQGISAPLRMFFFHAPNGRMLTIAGLRMSFTTIQEKLKGPMVVREIHGDGTFGPVYTLRPPELSRIDQPPAYDAAPDSGFVTACQQLLSDHVYLEEQDYGKLMPSYQRMIWDDPANWPDAGNRTVKKEAADFGEALCFFHRADGRLVGIAKRGWTILSSDEGATWTEPALQHTLIAGNGKVWGQRTPDGHYILAYNPSRKIRYPLVVVIGDDGVNFGDMRVVHGLLPPRRYAGLNKDLGASYVRGLSHWNNDGTIRDNAVWLVYSVNKEEIWVTRLPNL